VEEREEGMEGSDGPVGGNGWMEGPVAERDGSMIRDGETPRCRDDRWRRGDKFLAQ